MLWKIGEEEVAGLAGSKDMIIMVIDDSCGNHTTSCGSCLWWQQSSWAGGKTLETIGLVFGSYSTLSLGLRQRLGATKTVEITIIRSS